MRVTELIKEAKTVEIAIQAALKELDCSRDEAKIEIIQEPVKGIFGLTKLAKVKVTKVTENSHYHSDDKQVRPTREVTPEEMSKYAQSGKEILLKTLELMGIQDAQIKVYEEQSTIYLEIHSEAEGLLIGRHGQTLSSLQYLLNRIVGVDPSANVRFITDVGGYRERHKAILEKMTNKTVQRVIETKEEEELKAMNAFDRRIIHMSVKDHPEVVSYSLGEGSFRRVVIAPRSKETTAEHKSE
jgi:spoIIIJ-associated protein